MDSDDDGFNKQHEGEALELNDDDDHFNDSEEENDDADEEENMQNRPAMNKGADKPIASAGGKPPEVKG